MKAWSWTLSTEWKQNRSKDENRDCLFVVRFIDTSDKKYLYQYQSYHFSSLVYKISDKTLLKMFALFIITHLETYNTKAYWQFMAIE